MGEQIYLFDMPQPPARADHLFLAILPDANAGGRVSRIGHHQRIKHKLGNRQLAADRLHVSLYSLGTHVGVPKSVVCATDKAARAVAISIPTFEVKFDCVVSFSGSLNNRPLVLRNGNGNAALMEFHQRLGAELGQYGFPYDGNSRFTPHVTLLYSHRSIAEESINPVGWTVNEFVLVHSLVGKSRYIILNRWALQG